MLICRPTDILGLPCQISSKTNGLKYWLLQSFVSKDTIVFQKPCASDKSHDIQGV
jgi:hypothetical protein